MTPSLMNGHFQMDLLRRTVESGTLRPLQARRDRLYALLRAIEKHESALHAALRADLGKSALDAFTAETGFVQSEIRYTLKNLNRWSRPRRTAVPPMLQPSQAHIIPEPKGVVLIIGPWNYPAQLVLSPLVAALAAGNCAVIKPSELAPHTSAALKALIEDAFSPDTVQLIEGGQETSVMLLNQPFDHIFFTGGTGTGRAVARAAAEQLIPVTLELGGKCPVLICEDTDLRLAARRIARGKFMNAGQTCVAPDHVWVPREKMQEFFRTLEKTVVEFYGSDPAKSPDYSRIVNRRHFDRLVALAPDCIRDADDLFIAPTLILDPPLDSAIMQEEIFGPLLPVIPYDCEEQVLEWCRARPVPLAFYIFTGDREKEACLIAAVSSGGVCVNDTLMHIIPKGLPFGGKGASGMGAYHGKRGFEEFSHFRSVLRHSTAFDLRSAYPPFVVPLRLLKHFYRRLN